MCSTMNSRGRLFGPDGCQVPVGQGTCGETRTLEIIHQFKRLYQEKMHEIDNSGGGDCLQEKIKLQQEWISDLSDQNEMLVRAVEELEHEATERVRLLEDKLQKSAQCLCEEQKRIQSNASCIEELERKIKYYESFGDLEGMANELKCKRAECETLKSGIREQREEVQSLIEKIVILESENQLVKYNIKESINVLREKISRADKSEKHYKVQDIAEELSSIVKNLVNQTGGIDIKSAVELKDKQLKDQLELIKILVVKLFNTDKGLEFLQGRVSSVCEINKKNYLTRMKKKLSYNDVASQKCLKEK